MKDPADQFAQQKYAIVTSCLTEPRLSLLYRYACRLANIGALTYGSQVPDAPHIYGDVFMDGVLLDMMPLAEEVARTKLFPTYSYLRVYHRGQVLAKHKDRPSCEISLSICLGYQADSPWPLWIETPGGVSTIELYPGDAMFYRGIECSHWREPFEGEQAVQVFLHYVDQNGPYAEWKFDKRPSLASARTPASSGEESR
jgi:hypothetical protein